MVIVTAEKEERVYGYGGWTDRTERIHEILGYCPTSETAKEWIENEKKDKKWYYADWDVGFEECDPLCESI